VTVKPHTWQGTSGVCIWRNYSNLFLQVYFCIYLTI